MLLICGGLLVTNKTPAVNEIVKRSRGERDPTQGSMFSAVHEPTQDSAFGHLPDEVQPRLFTSSLSRRHQHGHWLRSM